MEFPKVARKIKHFDWLEYGVAYLVSHETSVTKPWNHSHDHVLVGRLHSLCDSNLLLNNCGREKHSVVEHAVSVLANMHLYQCFDASDQVLNVVQKAEGVLLDSSSDY